jgi:DNA-binding transcriptional ArsR family regulator
VSKQRDGQIDAERRIERELCHGAFDIEGAVDRLSALTHEIRFSAVFVLAEAGPLTVGGIAERTDTHRSEFYYHVTALVDAGLVCALGDGRRPEYRLTDAGEQFVREVFAALEGVAVAETDEPAERDRSRPVTAHDGSGEYQDRTE